jgi:serine/threonine protein kinase
VEDIVGVTLAEYVRQRVLIGRLPEDSQVISLGLQLAEKIEIIHRAGIIHRDITPNNIIIDTDDTCRLIDFGLSSITNFCSQILGRGTPGYASPQQLARTKPAITDDIYGFGAVLHFLGTYADPARFPYPLWQAPARLFVRKCRYEHVAGQCNF